MTRTEARLVEAESNLKWAAAGEFSARVTPAQAKALIEELARLRSPAWTPVIPGRRAKASDFDDPPGDLEGGDLKSDPDRAALDREADLAIHFTALGRPGRTNPPEPWRQASAAT